MDRLLGEPTTCPHGNPIPGSSYVGARRAPAVGTVASAPTFTVSRIPEELEFTPGLLDFLEDSRDRCRAASARSPPRRPTAR